MARGGKKVAIVCGAIVVALAVAAVASWREIAVQYQLFQLHRDPEHLLRLDPGDSIATDAVSRVLAGKAGRTAFVRLYLELDLRIWHGRVYWPVEGITPRRFTDVRYVRGAAARPTHIATHHSLFVLEYPPFFRALGTPPHAYVTMPPALVAMVQLLPADFEWRDLQIEGLSGRVKGDELLIEFRFEQEPRDRKITELLETLGVEPEPPRRRRR